MTTADEALRGQSTNLKASLAAGVESLAGATKELTFTKYVKLVLPLDGYVFWVKADLLSESALYNAGRLNAFALNAAPVVVTPAATIVATGSLHQVTNTLQEETENYAVNRMIFTSEISVADFNQIGPNVLFLAEVDGVRFAFSTRESFYREADLYHYVGNAVYSDMDTQIVDALDGFDGTNVVVSNSLPLWLALNGYAPPYAQFGNNLMLYASFLVPNNLEPPYGVVHVVPTSTTPLQAAPALARDLSHWQLATETVRITLYGTRNYNALDFIDCVNEYSVGTDAIGIMNMPMVRDEKRTQTELGTIAMKKTIEYQISYYQQRANDVARQLILSAIPSFFVGEQRVA